MSTVREVMREELLTVGPTTTVIDAARRMFGRRVGSALVVRAGTVEGIFTERDIMRSLAGVADSGRGSHVEKWMTRTPVTISPEATVGQALDLMLGGGFRHLPVMEDKRLVGIVSMRDLAGSIQKDG
jgi:CBS domain-containing protein